METNNKLREALVSVKKSIDEMGAASLVGDPETMLMSLTQVCAGLSTRIETALATPVRNCDVGTAEEQVMRYIQFCYAQMKRNNHCCGPCPCHEFVNGEAQPCTLLWAQMPYEEGGNK